MRFGAIILPSLFISLTGFAKSMRVENRSVRPVNSDLYSMKGEVSTAGANELYQTASSRYRYTALALSSGGKVECVTARLL